MEREQKMHIHTTLSVTISTPQTAGPRFRQGREYRGRKTERSREGKKGEARRVMMVMVAKIVVSTVLTTKTMVVTVVATTVVATKTKEGDGDDDGTTDDDGSEDNGVDGGDDEDDGGDGGGGDRGYCNSCDDDDGGNGGGEFKEGHLHQRQKNRNWQTWCRSPHTASCREGRTERIESKEGRKEGERWSAEIQGGGEDEQAGRTRRKGQIERSAVRW
jgi:hypothetical protein